MTNPVLSPTGTATIAGPQGEMDKEQPQSNDSHLKKILFKVPKDFGFIPVPRHLRYDPTEPFHFGLLLNIAFGFASTFSERFKLPPFF